MKYIYIKIFFLSCYLCFSQNKDDKIVIINDLKGGKKDIAYLLTILNKYKPKVIGININFIHKNTIDDSLLNEAIQNTPDLVIPTESFDNKNNTLIPQNQYYNYQGNNNYSNFLMMKNNKSVGFTIVGGIEQDDKSYFLHPSYIAEISLKYDSLQIKRFSTKNLHSSPVETIKIVYSANEKDFHIFSKDDIFSGNYPKDVFKDKIVLIGYLDPKGSTLYKTGNKKYPKMHGVIIDANIIKQILKEK